MFWSLELRRVVVFVAVIRIVTEEGETYQSLRRSGHDAVPVVERYMTIKVESLYERFMTMRVESVYDRFLTMKVESVDERFLTIKVESVYDRFLTIKVESVDERFLTIKVESVYERIITLHAVCTLERYMRSKTGIIQRMIHGFQDHITWWAILGQERGLSSRPLKMSGIVVSKLKGSIYIYI